MEYYMLLVDGKNGKRTILSIQKPELNNINNKAFFGALKAGKKLTIENFIPNLNFLKMLHEVVARDIETSSYAKTLAEKAKDGYVFIIDRRSKEKKAPKEDIVGGISVKGGSIVKGSYKPNSQYQLLTKEGLFQLPGSVEQALLEEINK